MTLWSLKKKKEENEQEVMDSSVLGYHIRTLGGLDKATSPQLDPITNLRQFNR